MVNSTIRGTAVALAVPMVLSALWRAKSARGELAQASRLFGLVGVKLTCYSISLLNSTVERGDVSLAAIRLIQRQAQQVREHCCVLSWYQIILCVCV